MVNSLIGSVLAAQVDEVLVTSSLCHLCKLVHRMAAKSVKLNLVFLFRFYNQLILTHSPH